MVVVECDTAAAAVAIVPDVAAAAGGVDDACEDGDGDGDDNEE